MTDGEAMDEVRLLILFYSSRGWNWLDAVEFTIWKHREKITQDES
jgi:hypothetical protein